MEWYEKQYIGNMLAAAAFTFTIFSFFAQPLFQRWVNSPERVAATKNRWRKFITHDATQISILILWLLFMIWLLVREVRRDLPVTRFEVASLAILAWLVCGYAFIGMPAMIRAVWRERQRRIEAIEEERRKRHEEEMAAHRELLDRSAAQLEKSKKFSDRVNEYLQKSPEQIAAEHKSGKSIGPPKMDE